MLLKIRRLLDGSHRGTEIIWGDVYMRAAFALMAQAREGRALPEVSNAN